MSNYLREEGYIRLVQCFLHPSLMVHRKESPNPLTEQHVLELGVDGRPQVIQRQGTYVDPLYQLFVPDQPEEQGGWGWSKVGGAGTRWVGPAGTRSKVGGASRSKVGGASWK